MTATFSGAKSAVALVVIMATTLSGCVTTGGGAGFATQTAMDKAIGQCVASVVISAGIGALAGAALGGNKGAGRGAVIGGVAGVGACAVLMQVAAAEDRARVRDAERNAVAANSSSTTSFSNKSGKTVVVRTSVSNAPVPKAKPGVSSTAVANAEPKFTACRYSEPTVNVDGQSASGGKQLWCRLNTGDWKAVSN
ncbi:hypothetical protein H4S14_001956 [Agrobacterium vitis]|nr:hypothetical protein [Agrobacterium vitis]MBE1438211.1 hypothetical protein [Agrobacterium vitis]